ncbi:DNA-binding LacI/PurR family transcriptional regulator [Curtobacterium pusillum]|uniref:DNA-binding LacI/PurR family transcriptional regulator n=1 Tax=Curtobacterium pusillum TaxID=69373 RepID=A0AAW3T4D9_9MICO|nr:substrate-binding domain-containing protein [Curtobacterium pusillum]MBA8989460.1 DNA-binding LacI/PurR family transcriptional regulator [Curtobacterium pusillum]
MSDQGASVGLVIRQGHDRDPVAGAVVRAVAGPLVAAGKRFVTRSVPDEDAELRVYRLWARTGGVAGVILFEVTADDPRPPLLRQIDMPFVALAPSTLSVDFPAVVVDRAASSAALAAFLDGYPARRRVSVTGTAPAEPLGDELGADDAEAEVLRTDDIVGASVRLGVEARDRGRTVLIVDGDHDAVAVLSALQNADIRVPEDVALICRSDSLVCQSASLPITAIDRRGREIGAVLGEAAIRAIDDGVLHPISTPAPVVVARETT